jgi:hypothetical protein
LGAEVFGRVDVAPFDESEHARHRRKQLAMPAPASPPPIRFTLIPA